MGHPIHWLGAGAERSAFEIFPEGIGQLGAEFVGHAAGGALHFFDEAVQVLPRVRDGHHANGGGLPCDRLIHLGYGDVEALLQPVFERADDLTPVFERVGVLNADFEGELGYGHGGMDVVTDSVRRIAQRAIDFFLQLTENSGAPVVRWIAR